jgi:hypothetical protein
MNLRVKARASKRMAKRAAKDIIIPSLPFVSKVKLPEAPVPYLLCSNEQPTESEKALICAAIAEAEVEVAILKQKFVRRVAAGRTSRGWEMVAKYKIDQANRFIHQHQSVISTRRRLPMEILQAIFVEVDRAKRDDIQWSWRSDHPRRTSDLPWELAQVCRIWRECALSLPLLWNHFPLMQVEKSHTSMQLAILTELIRRSGEAPLDISIILPEDDQSTHPFIDLLTQHSERWHTVRIVTSATILGLHAIKGRLSSLKALTFTGHCIETTIDLFEVAPQLEAVYLTWSNYKGVNLPLSQLLSLAFSDGGIPVTFPVVTMHCLVKLHVRLSQGSLNCFSNLTIPAIEEIKAVACRGNLIQSLTSLLARFEPHCPLKNLCIETDSIEPGSLTALLELTPCLLNLHTSIPVESQTDILNLAGVEGRKPLAPSLETCVFRIPGIVTGEISLAINALAFTRCDVSEGFDPTLPLSGEVRRLKALCIYSAPLGFACRQQAVLDGWPLADSGVSVELRNLKEKLHDELPDLNFRLREMRSESFQRKWDDRVGNILDRIGSLSIGDPAEIYVGFSLLFRKVKIFSKPPAHFSSSLPQVAQ